MIAHDNRSATAAALRAAVPYLRLYQGRTFVVKAGGAVFDDPEATSALMEQVGILHQVGIDVVFVHGGGPQTTRLGERLGVEARFVQGRRVTCEQTREVSTMVLNGSLNTRIVAACRRLSVPAVGLSGVDANLVTAQRRPPQQIDGQSVDYGYVGDLQAIDPSVVKDVLATRRLPVISPLSADEHGELLNLNADGVAAELACALGAAKLILVTGAPGLLEDPADPGTLVSVTDLAGLDRMEAEGCLEGGMLPKAAAVRTALRGGVERVHLLSHRAPDGLLLEVFTNEGTGTMVIAQSKEE